MCSSSPLFGEMIQFDLRIFFKWVAKNHQPGIYIYTLMHPNAYPPEV